MRPGRMVMRLAGPLLVLTSGRAALPDPPVERSPNRGYIVEPAGRADQFRERRAGSEGDASWKIEIREDGLYRLTGAQMRAAGLPPEDLAGSRFRLFCHTQEVAIVVSTPDLFGPADSLLFFGRRYDGEYSRANAYWLGFGSGGRRMTDADGTPPGSGPLTTNTPCRVRYNPKLLYRPYHQPLDESVDHWFAALVKNTSTLEVGLDTPNRLGGEARVGVELYGLSTGTHQVRVQVNGAAAGTVSFTGASHVSRSLPLASALLSDGVSNLSFLETAGGVSLLTGFTVDYPGAIRAAGAEYYFCGTAGTAEYQVTGVAAAANALLFDITRPERPVRITNAATPAGGSAQNLRFRYASATAPRFLLAQPAGIRAAPAPVQNHFRNLADPARQADYLLICPPEMRQPAYRLAKHRHLNGLRVAVAPLPDIYNEFGFGVTDALAIQQFIGYAYHHWAKPAPRYVVLIGEGSDDPLGFLGSPPPHQIPVRSGPTPFVVAAQDTWYGLVDGPDLLADLAIGRIPVTSAAQLEQVVGKIIAHDEAAILARALLVTDVNSGENNFTASSDTRIDAHLAAAGYARTKVYGIAASAARPLIQASFNHGVGLVTYVGHGSADRWSAQDYWNTDDAAALNNGIYPLVAIFSCNNGGFSDRALECLAEVFLESPRGAASTFAPTALSVQGFSDYVAGGLTHSLAAGKRRYLGDLALDAQLNLWTWNPNVAELLTYQILGDPGLMVNPP